MIQFRSRNRLTPLSALVLAASVLMLSSSGFADVILEDNFDSYSPGVLPSGFTLVWNGTGDANQVVTDAQSVSAPNSFTMQGQSGWTAVAEYPLTEWSRFITISCQVRIDAGGGAGGTSGSLCLWNETETAWGNYYLIMRFTGANEVTLASTDGDATILMTYNRDTWYNVHIRYDTEARTASIWIDGSQVADNLQLQGGSVGLDAFAFYNGSAQIPSYFDNLVIGTDQGNKVPSMNWSGLVALILLLVLIGAALLVCKRTVHIA